MAMIAKAIMPIATLYFISESRKRLLNFIFISNCVHYKNIVFIGQLHLSKLSEVFLTNHPTPSGAAFFKDEVGINRLRWHRVVCQGSHRLTIRAVDRKLSFRQPDNRSDRDIVHYTFVKKCLYVEALDDIVCVDNAWTCSLV